MYIISIVNVLTSILAGHHFVIFSGLGDKSDLQEIPVSDVAVDWVSTLIIDSEKQATYSTSKEKQSYSYISKKFINRARVIYDQYNGQCNILTRTR